MKYDLLSVADLHFGNDKGAGVVGKDGVNTFLIICEMIFKNIIKRASKENVPVAISGDLIDSTNPDPKTKRSLHRCFRLAMDLGVKIIIITGNHEYVQNGSLIDAYAELKFDNIFFIAIDKVVTINNIDFYCVPYAGLSCDEQYNAVSKMIKMANKTMSKNYKVLLLHYPIIGCKFDNGYEFNDNGFNLKSLLKKKGNPFDRIFAGDFHKRQRIKGVDNFLYLGQPYQGDFSSVGDKRGYTLTSFKENKDVLVVDEKCPIFMLIDDIEKPSDLKGDLTNKVVKIHLDVDADSKKFSDRAYELGALKVFTRRKNVIENDKDQIEEIDYINVSNMDDALMKYLLKHSPDKLDKDKLYKIGLNVVREARANSS